MATGRERLVEARRGREFTRLDAIGIALTGSRIVMGVAERVIDAAQPGFVSLVVRSTAERRS